MIVTHDEYSTVTESSLAIEEYEILYESAYIDIDGLTFNRITGHGFHNLTTFQQRLVKFCIIGQCQFIANYGSIVDLPITGYSAGSTSVQFNGSVVYRENGIATTKKIVNALKQTGLMVQIV